MQGLSDGYHAFGSNDEGIDDLVTRTVGSSTSYQSDLFPINSPLSPFETEDVSMLLLEQPNQIDSWDCFAHDATLHHESDGRRVITPNPRTPGHRYTTQIHQSSSSGSSNSDWEQWLRFSLSPRPLSRASPLPSNCLVVSPGRISIDQEHQTLSDGVQSRLTTINTYYEGIDYTTPLILARNIFFNMLSLLAARQLPWINAGFAERAGAEYLDLLSTSLEASSSVTRELSSSLKRQEKSWRPPSNLSLLASKWNTMSGKAESDSNQLAYASKPLYQANFIEYTSVGRLFFKLRGGICTKSPNITVLNVTFVPLEGICDNGFFATLSEVFDRVENPRMTRSIIPFNVIPYESPIVSAIEREDIVEVQNLFSSGKASMYDRLPEGSSLLSVSRRKSFGGISQS